jgi:hypothetical protein
MKGMVLRVDMKKQEEPFIDFLLPYKEDIIRIAKASLQDSDPMVTTLANDILEKVNWWH